VIQRPTRDLLGRHVGRRSHHHAHRGLPRKRLRGVRRIGRTHLLGQAEVQNLDATIRRNHHVGGFQVAMHDPLVVRRRERVGQRTGNFDDLLDGKAALRDQAVERLPLDQLHGEKVDAVGFLDREDSDDVRVIEGGDGASFTLEARQALGIVRHLGGQHFECHVATELGVSGAVYLAHAAGVDCGGNPIVGERAAEQMASWQRAFVCGCQVCGGAGRFYTRERPGDSAEAWGAQTPSTGGPYPFSRTLRKR